MLNFFFAFFFSFAPSPTDTFATPFSIAFSNADVQAASAASQLPAPIEPVAVTTAPAVTAPAPAPAPAVTTPAVTAPVATAPAPTAPLVEPPSSTLFANGGLLDPSRLGNIALAQTGRLSADKVIDKVQAFYKDTTMLRAKFRQTVKNKTFGKESVSDGWVYIKKPGKMRWDYYSKKNKKKISKSFISDGTTIWAVFHTDLQYYKKSVKDDLLPVAITFLSGQGDLKKDFTAAIDTKSGYGKKGDYVVKLSPKKPNAQYTSLWLVIDSTTYRVKQSVVLNSKGDTNRFAFHEGDTKKKLLDAYFVFNEKKNKKFRLVNPDKSKK